MNHKNLLRLLALALASATAPVQAASLSLVPSASSVMEGTLFTVDLVLVARDVTGTQPGLYGGEILVNFNPSLLSYAGFSATGGVTLPNGIGLNTSGSDHTVGFLFENATSLGTVGTFSFTAIGDPGSIATLGLADADDFMGTFFAYVPTYQPMYPDFFGASIEITAVPLPAGAWLLLTGVGALAARARWRTRR